MSTMEDLITLSKEKALQYLKVYNSDINWEPHINTLGSRIRTKNGLSESQDLLRRQIACTILLPQYDKDTITDPPEKLLFTCSKYHQYEEHDWLREFSDIAEKDAFIADVRAKALNLGVVYPLEYNPNTRQAFNWLCEEAERRGDLHDKNRMEVTKKFQNLVYAYGGVVICSVFGKPELKPKISKILNWRSGYFFERLIFEAYKSEEIIRIKQHELNKLINENSKLVKKVKV